MHSLLLRVTAAVAAVLAVTAAARAAEKKAGPTAAEVQAVVDKAAAYLKTRQGKDGSFSPKLAGPGVSALVVAALIHNGRGPQDPVVARALDYMEKQVQPDGGIYNKFLANYTTSVAIMAFRDANKDGKYETLLKNAAGFLKKLQYDEPESLTSDVKYGGFGYDKKSRPDVSNSAFAVEALIAAGVPKDDPAVQKALKFLSRCQNLPGETNDQAFARNTSKDDKGGFTYTPLEPDESHYKTGNGGLRSLGAMTYNGLKSFLYAGVSKDDPRVKAAVAWIKAHYTLDENPGMGKAGLYYYYHTFAKTMDALGQDTFVDAAGKSHNWRAELFEALRSRQREDGSWINQGERVFGEGDPDLATSFALLSLSYCRPKHR